MRDRAAMAPELQKKLEPGHAREGEPQGAAHRPGQSRADLGRGNAGRNAAVQRAEHGAGARGFLGGSAARVGRVPCLSGNAPSRSLEP